jgi:copper(I)-binding protein
MNHGKVAERLRGLRTSVSEKSQIIRLGDEVMSQPEFSEIVIRPGERLNLRQAGWCLLLTGLKVQLEADVGAYPGTLIFDQTGEIDVEFMCDEYSP